METDLVERPPAGAQPAARRLAGWVAGRALRPRAVEIVYHGRAIQIAPIGGGRARTGMDGATSWEALVGLIGLRADAELSCGGAGRRLARVPPACTCGARPSLGLRASAAAADPDLSGAQRQYLADEDVRGASGDRRDAPVPVRVERREVLMHALKVLSDLADLTQSAHPDTFYSDWYWTGSNPYFDVPALDHPARAGGSRPSTSSAWRGSSRRRPKSGT